MKNKKKSFSLAPRSSTTGEMERDEREEKLLTRLNEIISRGAGAVGESRRSSSVIEFEVKSLDGDEDSCKVTG